ncbi:HSP40/DnaJ peptide-binding protein [Venturia nashicola]|uniref:HSP40/DnaJ peptide-binding protein n=1 Tax=Venturia nashicola TaxID=86259 RepID=A0A4Z1P534_9PEZI|nr:HSP40/DnaJ peptide-binding protein [Venturia nashicola]TLD23487.1 HSP40/DnaJ peptide-binding protein [Venturia nashicola]
MALQSDLRTLKAVISTLSGQFSKSSRSYSDLQTLQKTILKVEIILRDPVFAHRQDAERIRRGLSDLVQKTNGNMQDYQDALLAANSSHLHSLHAELVRHTMGFQHAIDVIEGREMLPRPSPRISRAPSTSPDSGVSSSRVPQPLKTIMSTHLNVEESAASRITVSTPSSPYQPTVEEVPDLSDEDEVHDVQAYYIPPPEPTASAPTSSLKDVRRERVLQTPPQVVIRTATDDFPVVSPRSHAEPLASPLRTSINMDWAEPPSSSVTKTPQKERNAEDLRREIERLEAEMQGLKMSRQNSSDGKARRSPHHQSVDLGTVDDYPHHDTVRRQRASTTTSIERPKSLIERSSPEGRGPSARRSPREAAKDSLPMNRTPSGRSNMPPPSPRYASRSPRVPRSPQSAIETRFDDYWSPRVPDQSQSAADMFGLDPRASLPTVLETSMRRPTVDRTGRRSKRTSAYFDDPPVVPFQDFFEHGDGSGADFNLFDTAPPPESRNRAASRANESSPGGRQTPLPREKDAGINLEPTVKELAVSLEEIFYGATRRIKTRRKRYNAQSRSYQDEERILDVPIYKGLKFGSKIKFHASGDETMYGTKDIHFVLAELPHAVFVRKEHDLYCTVEIPLGDSLCGWQRSVESICGKTVVISHDGPTPPNWQDCFAGLGMCKYKRPDQRGDLFVQVSIKYPTALSERQKMVLRSAFQNP